VWPYHGFVSYFYHLGWIRQKNAKVQLGIVAFLLNECGMKNANWALKIDFIKLILDD